MDTTTQAPELAASEHNLVWIDLEMTGLSPATDRIIEIAVVVTDAHLTVRVEGPVFAIHQSDATLDAMDAWNKGTHGRRIRPSPSRKYPRPKRGSIGSAARSWPSTSGRAA